MLARLGLLGGVALAGCGPSPPAPSAQVMEDFTRQLDRKAAEGESEASAAAAARADARADAAARRIAPRPAAAD